MNPSPRLTHSMSRVGYEMSAACNIIFNTSCRSDCSHLLSEHINISVAHMQVHQLGNSDAEFFNFDRSSDSVVKWFWLSVIKTISIIIFRDSTQSSYATSTNSHQHYTRLNSQLLLRTSPIMTSVRIYVRFPQLNLGVYIPIRVQMYRNQREFFGIPSKNSYRQPHT